MDWIQGNLQNSLDTWNSKMQEIWSLVSQSPQEFKGGGIWNAIVGINGAMQAIGLALLVLFFVVGVMRTMGNFAEIKRISPPNGSHKTITKKQGVHETNEALLFFRSSVFH